MLLCATAFTTGFPEYRATYSVAPGRRELALTSPEDQDLDRIICPVLATGVKHGQLRLDAEGRLDRASFGQYALELRMPGMPALFEGIFDHVGRVEVFEMNGNRQFLEHGRMVKKWAVLARP